MPDAPRRRPGRPPLDPSDRLSAPLNLRLTTGQYDALAVLAARHRVSMAALARAAFRRLVKAADPPRPPDDEET